MTIGLLRHCTWFLAAVAFFASAPTAAQGATLLGMDAAEAQLLPPHDGIRKVAFTPTAEQAATLKAELGYALPRSTYTWRVAEQAGVPVGYLLFDNEIGKHEPITFAIAIDPSGAVSNMAVCVYREVRGDEIKRESFLRQFFGKRFGDPLRLHENITHISGATISSKSACTVVERALALWQMQFGETGDTSAKDEAVP